LIIREVQFNMFNLDPITKRILVISRYIGETLQTCSLVVDSHIATSPDFAVLLFSPITLTCLWHNSVWRDFTVNLYGM